MTWLYRLVLVVAIGAVYATVGRFAFIDYDDPIFVTENTEVQKGFQPSSVAWAFRNIEAANWIPITWLTHLLDWECWKNWAGGHHLQSLGWHVAGSLLLFEALRLATGHVTASFAVAMIYALHPMHVESVAWISERKGIVSSAFGMLTLLTYVIYTLQPGPDRLSLVVISYILGLMAKPMLIPLPLLLILLDYWPLRRIQLSGTSTSEIGLAPTISWGRVIVEKWPLYLASAVFVPIAYSTQQTGSAISSFEGLPLRYRLANADYSLVTYLRRYFWPSDLAVFYPHPKDSLGLVTLGVCLAILLTISVFVFRMRNKMPWLAVGWLWYLIMILPLSGMIPIGSHGMADRYSDLPLIGITIAIVWTISMIVGQWKSRA
ncbi:hypothetical protein K2X85_18020 [bacterium]|nr:hypothetical protein [bacterium]